MLLLFLSLHWLLLWSEVSSEVLVRYVCPTRSWCVSKHLCPQLATIDHSNSDDTEYLCGRPGSSSGYVCCSTQALLPTSFSPSSQLWHFTSDDNDLPDIFEGTLVLPWEEPAAGRYERETDDLPDDEVFVVVEPEQGKSKENHLGEILEALEGSGARIEHEEPVLLDSYNSGERKDAQEHEAPEVFDVYICPKRTLCVPWTLCESDDVSNLKQGRTEYICGKTADSMEYVCCSRPLRLTEEDEQGDDELPAPPVQPLSFENLVEAYNNIFTPPIPPTTTTATPADYLDRVLGLDQQRGRRRRDLSDLEQQGTVKLGELQPRTPLVISEVAADPALVEFFLNQRREQLAQRERNKVITFKPIGIDTTIRRQKPPVLQETEDVGFEVLQQRTPSRGPTIQSLTGQPSLDETTDSISPAQYIDQSQRVEDANQQVEGNVKRSSIKPLEAQILRSEDGDVNGRSSLGAFLDKLLTIKSPEDKHVESQPPAETYSQPEESSDKPRHHAAPASYPLHLFRPPGTHFNRPGNQAPHRFFPSAGQHEANNNPTAGHHHRPQTHRPNPPLSQHHNPGSFSPSYGTVTEDHVVPKVCGRGSRLGVLGRITTQRGEEGSTYYGEYPWHVAVLSAKDLSYQCAGVLVAPHMALTVAHCLDKLPEHTRLMLRVGDWDLASDSELYPAYDVPIASYIIHPEYYSGTLLNDIALLVLETAVEGLNHVQPACLPRQHTEFDHQHCRVSGWGQARHVAGDEHDTRSYSWLLRQTRLTVVPSISCEKHLRGTRQLGPFYRLPRTGALCAAGRQGRDACFGDGGGALVCRRHGDPLDGPYYVTGLVSWGIGCGQDIPAVYTKVSDYYPWILQHLQRLPPLKRPGQNPRGSASHTH